jgi:NTE family protein
VVLVLQGGGALGAYQVGVYEALHGQASSPTG